MPEAPLSYSSVRTYLECPLRWKFLYIDRLPEAPKSYFSFGRTIHTVLENLVRPLVIAPSEPPRAVPGRQSRLDAWGSDPSTSARGAILSPAALLDLYQRSWVSEGYTSRDEEERYRSQGAALLLAYRDLLERSPPAPVAVEQHLSALWDGIPVHGYLDRIDRTATGALEIVDYKTSRDLSHDDAKESDQLALYQVLVQKNYEEPVEALTLYHLRSLRPLTVPPRSARAIAELHERVGTVRDGVRERSFEPTPGRQCSRCDFRPICPEFREVPSEERARLEALVDRFAELRQDEQRLETDLRRAAEALHQEAERLSVHRIPGRQVTVVRRRDRLRPAADPPSMPSETAEAPGDAAPGGSAEPASASPGRARWGRWYWELEGPNGRE